MRPKSQPDTNLHLITILQKRKINICFGFLVRTFEYVPLHQIDSRQTDSKMVNHHED